MWKEQNPWGQIQVIAELNWKAVLISLVFGYLSLKKIELPKGIRVRSKSGDTG